MFKLRRVASSSILRRTIVSDSSRVAMNRPLVATEIVIDPFNNFGYCRRHGFRLAHDGGAVIIKGGVHREVSCCVDLTCGDGTRKKFGGLRRSQYKLINGYSFSRDADDADAKFRRRDSELQTVELWLQPLKNFKVTSW